jgi:hypothetical protein
MGGRTRFSPTPSLNAATAGSKHFYKALDRLLYRQKPGPKQKRNEL